MPTCQPSESDMHLPVSQATGKLIFWFVGQITTTFVAAKEFSPLIVTVSKGDQFIHGMPRLESEELLGLVNVMLRDASEVTDAYALAFKIEPVNESEVLLFIEAAAKGEKEGVLVTQVLKRPSGERNFVPEGPPVFVRNVDNKLSVPSEEESDWGFSEREWSRLNQSPLIVFLLVATARGKVKRRSISTYQDIVNSAGSFKNRLVKKILTNSIDGISAIYETLDDPNLNVIDELKEIGSIVDSRLSVDDAVQFKRSLLLIGKTVAETCGGFWLLTGKIGRREKLALAAVAFSLRMEFPK